MRYNLLGFNHLFQMWAWDQLHSENCFQFSLSLSPVLTILSPLFVLSVYNSLFSFYVLSYWIYPLYLFSSLLCFFFPNSDLLVLICFFKFYSVPCSASSRTARKKSSYLIISRDVPLWGTWLRTLYRFAIRWERKEKEEKSPAHGGIQTHKLSSFWPESCALPLCYNRCPCKLV